MNLVQVILRQLENDRVSLQANLDARKTQLERNKLGQFATPSTLAEEILKYSSKLIPEGKKVTFLDPAIGTGAFYSALRNTFPEDRILEALGFEIDLHYNSPATQLWANSGLSIVHGDFTQQVPTPNFNLIICNPPYVRHHHLANGEKMRLQRSSYQASGMKLSGLAGLYCYFLGLSHAWMQEDGIAGWLIPSEFMDVNYGREINRYLLEKVTLLSVHRFDPNDVQFSDALVSSAVAFFKKTLPPNNHVVTFSFGGTLLEPRLARKLPITALANESKWTRFPKANIRIKENNPKLSDFFQIKRGIATGDNSFFILNAEQIESRQLPFEAFRPILPSPRYLPENEISSDSDGLPLIERQLFVLDTKLPESEIKERYPSLFEYLEQGKLSGTLDRYICQHREPWYSQENRPPPPILAEAIQKMESRFALYLIILKRPLQMFIWPCIPTVDSISPLNLTRN
jgi:adenine-specific DNA-methyltransferase